MSSMENAGYRFFSNFDSGNLCKVEKVSVDEKENHDDEFQIWTQPDCYQTKFQVGTTCTWFFFGMLGGQPGAMIKFNIMNIGKQSSLFGQGMRPVCLVTSESDQWRRIDEDPTVALLEDGCILSFMFRNPANSDKDTFLAFTYPYTYEELQETLDVMEQTFSKYSINLKDFKFRDKSEIYVNRETVIKSLENRNLDLITITDMNGIQDKHEETLPDLFPDEGDQRSQTFNNKEIIFISSRVHPGETCASYVMKGFMDFLLFKDNKQAMILREKYVFKILPMLNPDGVAEGHYRTDTRGVNLNRVYDNPSKEHHPTIFAAKQLIDYYHSLNKKDEHSKSSVFLYIDIHGHVTEKGIFLQGNQSSEKDFKIQTFLFPKIVAINNSCLSYKACKTTNLTLNDLVNGTNPFGCGSSYAHRATGLAQAYTLECSVNGGDTEMGEKEIYTPETYDNFGKSLAESILDLTESNLESKIRNTPMKNLAGVTTWVTKRMKAAEISQAARNSSVGKLFNLLPAKVPEKTEENNVTEIDSTKWRT